MTTGTGNGKKDEWSGPFTVFIGFLFFSLFLFLSPETGPTVRAHWPWLAGAGGLVLAGVLGYRFSKSFRTYSDSNKGLLVTIGAVLLILAVLNAITLLPEAWRDRTLAVLFVLVAAILPPAMYYLFLVTRRPSLFDEYVTNLHRLGLIPADEREVDAYLQKFEATYGPIDVDKRTQALKELVAITTTKTATAEGQSGTGSGWGRLLDTRVGSLLTPGILLPLGLSTLLVGVGWMLLLPVWRHDVSLLNPYATIVGFGFAGAYFYSVQLLFRRFLRRDLRPSVYIAMGQRIVLTVIASWILAAVVLGPGSALARSAVSLSELVTSRLGGDAAAESTSAGRQPAAPTPVAGSGPAGAAGESPAPAGTGGDGTAATPAAEGTSGPQDDAEEGLEPPGATDDTGLEDAPAAGTSGPTGPAGSGEENGGGTGPTGDGGAAATGPRQEEGRDAEKTAEEAAATGGRTTTEAEQEDGEEEPPATPLVLAFLLGMFPGLLWDILVSRVARLTGAKDYLDRMKPDLPLSRIDGVSFWHEARLEEEDVESAPNLATADMVELMLNTRFSPGRIVDWVDQAILVTALGPAGNGHAEKLRQHGIRTASALKTSYERAGEKEPPDVDKFEGILGEPEGRSAVRTIADVLDTNPNLRLVRNWQVNMSRGIPQKPAEKSEEESKEENGDALDDHAGGETPPQP